MEGKGETPMVLKFEASTGVPSRDNFVSFLKESFDVLDIKPLMVGHRGRAFMKGLIYVGSDRGFEKLNTALYSEVNLYKVQVSPATLEDQNYIMDRLDVKMFVKLKANEVDVELLREYFASFGQINYVQLIDTKARFKNTRLAFVFFELHADMNKAIATPEHLIGSVKAICYPFVEGANDESTNKKKAPKAPKKAPKNPSQMTKTAPQMREASLRKDCFEPGRPKSPRRSHYALKADHFSLQSLAVTLSSEDNLRLNLRAGTHLYCLKKPKEALHHHHHHSPDSHTDHDHDHEFPSQKLEMKSKPKPKRHGKKPHLFSYKSCHEDARGILFQS